MSGVAGSPKLAANFIGTPIAGPAPLTVSFTDTSSGFPTSWSWDFGDGANATDQNPSHSYTKGDPCTVALTTSNAGGSALSASWGSFIALRFQLPTLDLDRPSHKSPISSKQGPLGRKYS